MSAELAELEQLYRSRYGHFVRVATAVAGDVNTGRDAVQNAFATAVRKRRSFRGAGRLEAWVWRIVVNEARHARRDAVQPTADVEAVASSNGHAPDELGVRTWIAALPERQRAAVFLRYYADLDYDAIADLLGIRVGTVSATLSAAHANLRSQAEEVRE
jgi:RNA polymerase sigma factor (sigma-70 family)